MKSILSLTMCLALFGVAMMAPAPVSAESCENGYIANSFVNNRFTIDKKINLNKPYWSAYRVSIFGDSVVEMCACDPVVVAGSTFTRDDRSTPVEVGEYGWLSTAQSRQVLEEVTVEAELNGSPIPVLSSGVHKFENFISNPDGGANTTWTWLEAPYETVCDWLFENSDEVTDPAPQRPRANNESCWAVSFGIDLSDLEPGDYTLTATYSYPEGNGPADAEAGETNATITVHVLDCE